MLQNESRCDAFESYRKCDLNGTRMIVFSWRLNVHDCAYSSQTKRVDSVQVHAYNSPLTYG